MSKMGQELDKRLEENKYEMWELLKKINFQDGWVFLEDIPEIEKVLAKIDGGE